MSSEADAASVALIAQLQAQDAYNNATYASSDDQEQPSSDYEGDRPAKRRKGGDLSC